MTGKRRIQTVCGIVVESLDLGQDQHKDEQLLQSLRDIEGDYTDQTAGIRQDTQVWGQATLAFREHLFELLFEWGQAHRCRFLPCPIDRTLFKARNKTACPFCKAKGPGCPGCNTLQSATEAGTKNAVFALYREIGGKNSNRAVPAIVTRQHRTDSQRLVRILNGNLSRVDVYLHPEYRPTAQTRPKVLRLGDLPDLTDTHLELIGRHADIASTVVTRYIELVLAEQQERYPGERGAIESWYKNIARQMVDPGSIDPPIEGAFAQIYKNLRPHGWTAHTMAKA